MIITSCKVGRLRIEETDNGHLDTSRLEFKREPGHSMTADNIETSVVGRIEDTDIGHLDTFLGTSKLSPTSVPRNTR